MQIMFSFQPNHVCLSVHEMCGESLSIGTQEITRCITGVRCRYRVNLHGTVPRNSTVQPHYYYVHVQEMQLVQV